MNSVNKSDLPRIAIGIVISTEQGILPNKELYQIRNSTKTRNYTNKKFHQIMNSANKSDLPRIGIGISTKQGIIPNKDSTKQGIITK